MFNKQEPDYEEPKFIYARTKTCKTYIFRYWVIYLLGHFWFLTPGFIPHHLAPHRCCFWTISPAPEKDKAPSFSVQVFFQWCSRSIVSRRRPLVAVDDIAVFKSQEQPNKFLKKGLTVQRIRTTSFWNYK